MANAGFDYTHAQATAARLIARFGLPATIRRQTNTGPAYDPVAIATDYPCMLVVLDYDDSRIDGTMIRRTDKLIYLAATGLTPAISDRIIADAEFSLIHVKPLAPAGVPVYFEIQART